MTRLESLSVNARHKTRVEGVTYEPKASNGKWVVRAVVKGRLTTIGCRDTEEMAEEYFEQFKSNKKA